jgi:hypothetical protein
MGTAEYDFGNKIRKMLRGCQMMTARPSNAKYNLTLLGGCQTATSIDIVLTRMFLGQHRLTAQAAGHSC